MDGRQIEAWLKSLSLDSLCQWDMLVFLYRHLACLVSAEHIARLLGHPTGEVVAALDHLESVGLVERSRVDQGVRLYQFAAPADPRPGDALDQLLTVAGSRAGRLLLSQKLGRGNPPDTARAGSQETQEARFLQETGFLQRAEPEGSASWRKAI